MDASAKRDGRDFYACPHCGHCDPNAIDYLLGTFWRVARGTSERCLKCKQPIRRAPRTFLVIYVVASVIPVAYAFRPFRSDYRVEGGNMIFSADPGAPPFLILAGYAAGITLLLLLPRLVYRGFGLRMFEAVVGRMDSSAGKEKSSDDVCDAQGNG